MDSETKKNVVFTGLQGSWMLSNGHRMQTRILAPKRGVGGSVSPAGSVGAPASPGRPKDDRALSWTFEDKWYVIYVFRMSEEIWKQI